MTEQLGLVGDIEIRTWMQNRERYYQAKHEELAEHVSLSIEALQQLLLCRDIVRHLLPKPIHDEIRETMDVAAELLDGTKKSAYALGSFATARGRGTIDYTPHQRTIEKLQAAMRENRICTIKYRPRLNEPAKALVVAPVRLMAYREAFYARCYAHNEQGHRTFGKVLNLAVHRIAGMQVTSQTFAVPDANEDKGTFGLEFSQPFKVRVAFSPSVATYIAERTWSRDQRIRKKRDGGLLLTFTSTSRPETVAWLLGFGANVRVLEPEDVRKEVVGALEAALSQYKT